MQGRSIGQWLEIGGSKEGDGANVLDVCSVCSPATAAVETAPTMGMRGVVACPHAILGPGTSTSDCGDRSEPAARLRNKERKA